MNYLAKPIMTPGTNNAFPDWLIYPFGESTRPLAVISDMDINRIVVQWCEFHGHKIIPPKAKRKYERKAHQH